MRCLNLGPLLLVLRSALSDDCSVLCDLFSSVAADSRSLLAGWQCPAVSTTNQSCSCCTAASPWIGVLCTANRVSSLNLENVASTVGILGGTLPRSIGQLNELRELNLNGLGIKGSIPAEIGLCSSLTSIRLSFNKLTGTMPDLSALTRLTSIEVKNNSLRGPLPPSLFTLTNLTGLRWGYNDFTGKIPSSIGNLVALTRFSFHSNYLTGALPSQFGKLTALVGLYLNDNELNSQLPSELVKLQQLQYVWIFSNSFTGTIPRDLASMPLLQEFDASYNCLTGTIPNLGQNIYFFDLGKNNLRGPILASTFAHLRNLSYLALDNNHFTGSVPSSIAQRGLTFLDLNSNNLQKWPPKEIWALPHLKIIDLSENSFSGPHPQHMSGRLLQLNLSYNFFTSIIPNNIDSFLFNVSLLNVQHNLLTGTIPSTLIMLTALRNLNLGENFLEGTLPEEIGNLRELTYLNISCTLITGSIPSSLGGLTNLVELRLFNNFLQGSLPPSLALATSLKVIRFDQNSLVGTLPPEFAQLVNLQRVFFFQNRLSGRIPPEIGRSWVNLTILDVSDNKLFGGIPEGLFATCKKLAIFVASKNCLAEPLPGDICQARRLQTLLLDGLTSGCPKNSWSAQTKSMLGFNGFICRNVQGTLPSCIFSLPNISTICASGNGIRGELPQSGWSSTLNTLELSNNLLEGEFPEALKAIAHRFDSLDLQRNRIGGNLDGLQPGRNMSLALSVNRLSGACPVALGEMSNPPDVLTGNLFGCPQDTGLPLPENDVNFDSYECGASVNALIYTIVTIAIILGVFAVFSRRAKQMLVSMIPLGESLPPTIDEYLTFLTSLRRMMLRFSIFFALLLPFYSILKAFYATHEHDYIWNPSMIFLSGIAPASILLTLLSLALFSIVAHLCFVFDKHSAAVVAKRGSTLDLELEREEEREQTQTQTETQMQTQMRSSRTASFRQYTPNDWRLIKAKLALRLMLVAVVNMCSSLAANMFFVEVTSSSDYSKEDKHTAVFLLAVYKLTWRRALSALASWRALRFGVSFREESSLHGVLRIGQAWLLAMQVFNLVVAPAIAMAMKNDSCFKTLFKAPAEIQSSFTVKLQVAKEVRWFYGDGSSKIGKFLIPIDFPFTVSYRPPFYYTFDCSVSLAVEFLPVFFSMALVQGFVLPIIVFLIRRTLNLPMLDPQRWATTSSSSHLFTVEIIVRSVRLVLLKLLPSKLMCTAEERKLLAPTVSLPSSTSETSHATLPAKAWFVPMAALSLEITLDLVLFLSFGLVCPLLALAIVASVYSRTLFWHMLVAGFVSQPPELQLPGELDLLSRECSQVWSGGKNPIYRVRYLLVVFPSLFLAFFVWDICGDSIGGTSSTWAPLLMCLFPSTAFWTYRQISKARAAAAAAVAGAAAAQDSSAARPSMQAQEADGDSSGKRKPRRSTFNPIARPRRLSALPLSAHASLEEPASAGDSSKRRHVELISDPPKTGTLPEPEPFHSL